MVFHKIELADWEWIATYCRQSDTRQLNYCFEVLFLWRDICDFEVAEQDGFLFIKTFHLSKHNFLFPLGEGDLKAALEVMEAYSAEKGCEFQLFQINERQKTQIEQLYPERYTFEPSRDEFEYLFESERLANLKGKKLQPKRNHINYFTQHNDWSFDVMTEDDILEVMMFSHRWDNSVDISVGSALNMENSALMNVFESFSCLHLQGGILRVEGRIVAFAIGCPLSSDTYLILFEKAEASARGAYAMINREFVRCFCADFQYVNRAEDNGDEGLRQAKLSYYPDILQEVFVMRRTVLQNLN